MVFINKLADHSHHDDLRVDDELVVQNLKLPTNATVTGLTVNHIQGLSDSLGNLTIDESALLADVNTQIAGKADASSVYTQTVIRKLSKLISNELCASVMFVILAVSVSSLTEKETVYVGVGLV